MEATTRQERTKHSTAQHSTVQDSTVQDRRATGTGSSWLPFAYPTLPQSPTPPIDVARPPAMSLVTNHHYGNCYIFTPAPKLSYCTAQIQYIPQVLEEQGTRNSRTLPRYSTIDCHHHQCRTTTANECQKCHERDEVGASEDRYMHTIQFS
jgi:hypothetical protein